MEMLKDRPVERPQPGVFVIPIGDTMPNALGAADSLRAAGIRTGVDMTKRKLKKSLAAVAARGIRFAILVGNDEAAAGKVRLKDMDGKTEAVLSIEEVIYQIEKIRS
ncbi:MAG: hisS [Paenibacillaceae bacterium]|nr:hisS [Paenibacillaceae bacterium]